MRVGAPSGLTSSPERGFAFGTRTADALPRGALLYWAALMAVGAAAAHGVGVLSPPPRPGLLTALLSVGAFVQIVSVLAVVVVPTRRRIVGAMLVEVSTLLLWLIARGTGIPIGATAWRPETLGVQDLYLPAMEGVSALLFLCLFGRTWMGAPRRVRTVAQALLFCSSPAC